MRASNLFSGMRDHTDWRVEGASARAADAGDEIKRCQIWDVHCADGSQESFIGCDKRQLLIARESSVNFTCRGKVQRIQGIQVVFPDELPCPQFEVRGMSNHQVILPILDNSLHNSVPHCLR